MRCAALAFPLLALIIAAWPSSAAQVADCLGKDPQVFTDVYACISSHRMVRRSGGAGRSLWTGQKGESCYEFKRKYNDALKASVEQAGDRLPNYAELKTTFSRASIMNEEGKALIQKHTPSCAVIAMALNEIEATAPYWGACTGYGELPDAEQHLASCLSHMVPAYYGHASRLEQLQGCDEVRQVYEQALRAASPGDELPPGYEPPSCGTVAEVVTGWSGGEAPDWEGCLGYDPANMAEHMKRCLGSGAELAGLDTCQKARDAYEQRLVDAYGGLPEGYLLVPCGATEQIVAEARRYREERVARMSDPEAACPSGKAARAVTLYEGGATNPLHAPAKCGNYWLYVDRCIARTFRSPYGVYTLSTTPPDEPTDHIQEVITLQERFGNATREISRGRTIPADRVWPAPFGRRMFVYYELDDVPGQAGFQKAYCFPHGWTLSGGFPFSFGFINPAKLLGGAGKIFTKR